MPNAPLGRSAEFHNLLVPFTTVTVYTGRTRPDSLWGWERLNG
jgi:hypothetical protein